MNIRTSTYLDAQQPRSCKTEYSSSSSNLGAYSMSSISDSESLAFTCSIIVQSFLYGVFVLLFAVSVYFLVRPTCDGLRPTRSPNIVVLVTTLLLFLLVTLSWIIHILSIVFYVLEKTSSTRIATSLYAAQIALYIFQVLVVDFIMVYRLYIVWSHDLWICIFPALCWLATAGYYPSITRLTHLPTSLFQ